MPLQVREHALAVDESNAGRPVRTECSSRLKQSRKDGMPIMRGKARIDIGWSLHSSRDTSV